MVPRTLVPVDARIHPEQTGAASSLAVRTKDMVPRTLVPVDAWIRPEQMGGSAVAARQDLLVPRRLIPADAVCGPITRPEVSSETLVIPTQRNSIVPRLLVPRDAMTGSIAATKVSRVPAHKDIFQESVLAKAPLGHGRNPAEWLISIGIHAAIIAAVLIVPLYHTQTIDLNQLEITFLVAPLPPAAPPPPPPPLGLSSQQAARRPSLTHLTPARLTMPVAVLRNIQELAKPEESVESSVFGGMIGGVPGGQIGGVLGGVPGGVLGGVLGGIGTGVPPPPPPPPVVSNKPLQGDRNVKPLQVGGNVKEPQSVYKPQPEYPLLARYARIEGVVEIDAIIDEQGNVVQMRAVSGHPLLITAALQAVKQWKYEPTYLNGVPWPKAPP
jgi:protein TonB